MSDSFLPISKPFIGTREKELVLDALDSGWVSSIGKYIDEFETSFARYCGTEYALAVNNGTTGLHLALATLALAAVAGGQDPTSFGGTNLVVRLAATLTTAAAPKPTPTKTPSHAPTTSASVAPMHAAADPTLAATGGDGRASLALTGGLAFVLAGVGLVAAGRRRLVPVGRHGGRDGREVRDS